MRGLVPRLSDLFLSKKSDTYKNQIILWLDPRIHAVWHEPAKVLAGLAVRDGVLCLPPGVDDRVKPDHDEVVKIEQEDLPDSSGLVLRIHAVQPGYPSRNAVLADRRGWPGQARP